jgi:hypothetical protein
MPDETGNDSPAQHVETAARLNGWDAYAVGVTRVLRSPDRRLIILHDYCSEADCLALINQWQPLPLTRTGH